MDSETPSVVEIPLSKRKVIGLFLGAIAFISGSIWLWSIADNQQKYHPLLVKGVAAVGVAFFGLCASIAFAKFWDKRPGLIIDEEGLVDHSSGVSAGRILWEEVVALRVSEVAGQRFLTIIVADPEKFANRGNFLSRMANAANAQLTGSPINISSNTLCIKFDDLVATMIAAFDRFNSARRTKH